MANSCQPGILTLIWSPHSLPVVAVECSNRRAASTGFVCLASLFGSMFNSWGARISEPQANLYDYLCYPVGPRLLALGLVIGSFSASIFYLFVEVGVESIEMERHRNAIRRVLWLTPVPILLPVVAWSFFSMISELNSPGFKLAGGKPPWVHSPLIRIPGSPVWLIFGAAFVIILAQWSIRQPIIDSLKSDDPSCQKCGYNLTGNISGICPECGTPATAADP